MDLIGSDAIDGPEMHTTPGLTFLNLRGSKEEAGLVSKVSRVLVYYWRLIAYAATAGPKIFHVLWNNKFESFDRTFLMLYYKVLAKKVVFTAHNVNAGKRDGNDSWFNRTTLRIQYHLADHVFVHTEKMKGEMLREFGVPESAVSVIPFGVNNSVPNTDLTAAEAKRQMGVGSEHKTILFFGAIRPYKGLDFLVDAFLQLAAGHPEYRLIIAGQPRKGCEKYLEEIQQKIAASVHKTKVIQKIQYVPDEETEIYFKAADVLALPYTHVFQSGVLFLAQNFGLPVVATSVGSLKEDVIEGRTGFSCRPSDSTDLAAAIARYFTSHLFETLEQQRNEIREHANEMHSWDVVADTTKNVYCRLAARTV